MSDGVAPAWAAGPEVCVVVENPLVDLRQHHLLLLGTEDGHGDETWRDNMAAARGVCVLFVSLDTTHTHTMYTCTWYTYA